MDPTACLMMILGECSVLGSSKDEDIITRMRDGAVDRLRDLADWLEKGGFAPDVIKSIRAAHLPGLDK